LVDTADGLSLREFDGAIEEGYRRLFPGEPDKANDLLNWRFQANPHGAARFAAATEGNELVGMIALVPTRLANAPGARGFQAIDTVVHPSQRGRGLFVRLGATAQEGLRADVLWGFPNANAAPGWYGRLGWTNFGAAPLLVRPLRSGFVLGRLHPRLRVIDFSLVRSRKVDAHVYHDGARLSGDFDKLWQRVRSNYGIAVDRSGEWMRWRLFDKPGADYRCAGVKNPAGDLDAFVATKVCDKHGSRLCYIMEAVSVSSSHGDLTHLLVAELGRAARGGAEAALAWCPKSAPNYAAYRRAGFLPVPARLRPIEINFGAKALHPGAAPAAEQDARWYVSFLDSDTN
jgi:hypothetical protein